MKKGRKTHRAVRRIEEVSLASDGRPKMTTDWWFPVAGGSTDTDFGRFLVRWQIVAWRNTHTIQCAVPFIACYMSHAVYRLKTSVATVALGVAAHLSQSYR
jgi:hypothetical protein